MKFGPHGLNDTWMKNRYRTLGTTGSSREINAAESRVDSVKLRRPGRSSGSCWGMSEVEHLLTTKTVGSPKFLSLRDPNF